MVIYIDELEQKAKKNREKFLKPYWKDFKALLEKTEEPKYIKTNNKAEELKRKNEVAKNERQRANIIIDLIKKEPSHLAEPWILWTVVEWLRDGKYKDFVEEAFFHQKGRNRPTERQRDQIIKDRFLISKIDRIKKEKGLSTSMACVRLALEQFENPVEWLPKDPGTKQNPAYFLYKKYKKKMLI